MADLPIELLDTETLIAALVRIQNEGTRPFNKRSDTTTVPDIISGAWKSQPKHRHDVGMSIAAELWSRGVLTFELPTAESVVREADALIEEATR